MSPSLVANADLSPVTSGTVKGRVASVYSKLQTSRIDHALPLPSVLKNPFKIVDGPASSAAGNPGQFRTTTSSIKQFSSVTLQIQDLFFLSYIDEIAKLFPNLFGQPSALLVPNGADAVRSDEKLKIGVVLSGGQAPGGHNVISGIYGEYKSENVI